MKIREILLAVLLAAVVISGAIWTMPETKGTPPPAPVPPSITIVESRNVNGITVTLISISGRYCAITSTGGICRIE